MYINYDDQAPARVIGSFTHSKNEEFKNGITSLMEGFKGQMGVDPLRDIYTILENDVLAEQYKDALIGDILDTEFDDEYLNLMPKKLEQVYENSAMTILKENYGAPQLNPIVGYTLPILKKNFIENHGKDIVMTEVPSKPVIKLSFERKFLKDKEQVKPYIISGLTKETAKELNYSVNSVSCFLRNKRNCIKYNFTQMTFSWW